LDPQQFVALRADSKQYHDNLLMNILTYVYGCRFGIAVFERIESEVFNPNVALEVGYMMGLGKPMCYLKERTLRTLHTDLMGQLYREFDLQTCDETIPPCLLKWMSDKGIMANRVQTSADAAET
jgi:nucleoside 2-deoxyribosyltransferase